MTLADSRFSIGDFRLSRVDLKRALRAVEAAVERGDVGYICVSNARSCYQSNHEADYCRIQNGSLLTLPDGRPLVWIAHYKGYRDVDQVAGNDLFHALLKVSGERGYSHYFYGSTPETIEKMRSRAGVEYPGAEIKAAVAPPFQPLEEFDIPRLAEEINALAPTFFWIGLGAPKQERLMALLQPHLKHTICIGVGLVFEYYAGNVKRAPEWVRKLGLEWLVRSLQQPFHSKKRNFPIVFLWMLRELLKSKFQSSRPHFDK